MRVREFEARITSLSHWSRSKIDQRTRRLRELRMLPQGGRGLHAPQIAAEHAANLLISLGTTDNATEAAIFVMTYAPMIEKDGTFLGTSFAETLTALLEDPGWKLGVQEVRMCHSWPEATVLKKDGKIVRFGPEDQPETGYGYLTRTETVFTDGFLQELAMYLAEEPDDNEWTAEA